MKKFIIILAVALIGFQADPTQAVSTNVVISQVYGGGGNVNGLFKNDFIEIFNLGTTPVSLGGWSLQYASATGTGLFGAATNFITLLPSVSLQSGQYFLIQEAQGANTAEPALPTPDFIDLTPINMSLSGAKVALVNTTTPLGCNGGSTPCNAAQLAEIIDLVGWDGANFYEGAAAPTTTNQTALFRINGGLTDTDNNFADFVTGTPNPRNTASPLNPPTSVPEPSTILLLGAGLAGLGILRRRVKK